jgi:hypothetical protein
MAAVVVLVGIERLLVQLHISHTNTDVFLLLPLENATLVVFPIHLLPIANRKE